MATRQFKIVHDANGLIQWRFADERIALEFRADEVDAKLRDAVFAYGVKQIIADGGALDKSATIGEKVAMMEKRANALRNGTWGTRQASAPTITDDLAIATLAKSMGKTVEEIRAMLGE